MAISGATDIYGKWTRIEAQDVDLVGYAATIAGDASTEEEFNAFKTWFTGKGYAYANLKELDNKAGNNGAYLGLKTKSDAAYIAFNVPANKRVTIKLGSMAAAAEMYINGVKDETQALTGGSTGTGDNFADWHYDVTEASTLKLQMKTGNTCVVKAITIGEIPAESDDATLKDLTVGGTTIAGFAANVIDYYVELPYGSTSAPTVSGTANDDNVKSVAIVQASDPLPGDATITVTAEDNVHNKVYTVHFMVAPKFGVELIKATHTGATTADVTGYIGGTADKNTQGGGKLGTEDHYFGVKLANDEQFKAGDLVVIKASNVSATVELFDTKSFSSATDSVAYLNKGNFNGAKMYYYTLEADADQLYLYRTKTAKGQMNPTVEYIAVYRLMAPFIESFEVAGVDATITGTTITAEVSEVTDITALTPTVKFWANGGGTITPTTAQDFSSAVEYTVSSSYADDATGDYAPVTYTATVTKAAAIKEVVISGTLSVLEDETTTLSAVVYDTNDDVASIQDVTWSVKAGDETYASVDANGVVTGKAVGTAQIIATSVADDTKSAQVEVTISENPCRAWNAPATSWSDAMVTIGYFQIKRGECPASSSVTPYSGASSVYGIKVDGTAKFIELTMSDGSQFESLTLGVASGSNGSSPKYALVASSAVTFNAAAVLSIAEYAANAKDAAQALNDIDLPTGTRNVRIYRTYEGKGEGTSVFMYYANACKKELVPLTSISVADMSLAVGVAGTPVVTLNPTTADVASYVWNIESDETGVATIDPATGVLSSTAAGAVTVKVTATDAFSTIRESNVATINIVNKYVDVVPVGETITWSWSGKATSNISIVDVDTVLANYLSGTEWQKIAGKAGEYAYRAEGHDCYQGTYLYFKATVPGMLVINTRYASSGAKLNVNGHEIATLTDQYTEYKVAVPSGNVVIEATGNQKMRIKTMTFDPGFSNYAVTDNHYNGYTRNVTEGRFGTICLPKAGIMVGAELFEIAYYGQTSQKIFFDNIPSGEMEAGIPYIFLPKAGVSQLGVFYTDAANASAGSRNGLIGSYTQETITPDDDNYILLNNQYCEVVSTEGDVYVGANRAYIHLTSINPSEPALAPGRRRISMGVQSQNAATGMDELNASETPVKMLIDGQLFILRGEKMYNANGQLVK